MSIVKHFSVHSVKPEYDYMETVEFFVASNFWNISNINEICETAEYITLHFLFETFASNRPSVLTITKPLCDKIGKIFFEGLKWMYKLFEINDQKDFKNMSFSQNPLNILLYNLHREIRLGEPSSPVKIPSELWIPNSCRVWGRHCKPFPSSQLCLGRSPPKMFWFSLV